MTQIMINELGQQKIVKQGFSWTIFFFGAFVPLCRGDWKWFLIMLLANSFTFGMASLVFMFKYNEWYINDLLGAGYKFK